MNQALSSALGLLDSKPLDYEVAKARALMVGYDARWYESYRAYDVIAVESEFAFPLVNPETSGTSRTFIEAGKIDGILRKRDTGRYLVLEHKTTSEDIEPGSNYWLRLDMDTQCSKYVLALRAMNLETGNLLYDVIHKPASKPHQLPVLDGDGVKVVLDANGERVKTLNGKKWRESGDTEKGYVLQTVQETPEQYGARLTEEIASNTMRYFGQRETPRLDTQLLDYMSDAWQLSQEILNRRHCKSWPRNPDACMRFSGCEFFELCTGRASVDGIRFRRAPEKHRELEMKEAGRELLTNSRLSALRKCARYHFHRYEQPIEQVAEESEALRFGTLFHNALRAYFEAMKH